MSISSERAAKHIDDQTRRLKLSSQRSFWPNYLYHTTHVTNAVAIVRSGILNSRTAAGGQFHDVANQGALAANQASHSFARLYFRPRNGYHLRTEGIKCLVHPYRQENQTSIPVTFLFDFKDVITREGVKFTKGNIQRTKNLELVGDDSFNELDFEAIYHDDSVTPEQKEYIHDCRMAEVMVPNGLKLEGALKAIFFRTRWDLETFRYQLEVAGGECPWKVQVEQITNSLYMHMGLYVIDLDFLADKLHLKFHLPVDYRAQDGTYKIRIEQIVSGVPSKHFDKPINVQSGTLTIVKFLPNPDSVWRILLEDVLAFEGRLPHAQSQVFG